MEIKGRTEYSAKMGDFPTLRLAFKGVPTGHTNYYRSLPNLLNEDSLSVPVNLILTWNRDDREKYVST